MPSANGFLSGLPEADRIVLDRVHHFDVDVMVHAAGCQIEAPVLR
jgi:hypothetical protein